MKAIEYQTRLDYLAKQLGCRLDQMDANTPGMMYVEFGYVEGPTMSGPSYYYPNLQSRYMVCLHELGHFAHGHTQGRPPKSDEKFYFDNGVLRSEAEAWQWAMDNANEELEWATRIFMWETCMGSYYRSSSVGAPMQRLYNGNRHHVPFTWDKPDTFFWMVKSRMEGENCG